MTFLGNAVWYTTPKLKCQSAHVMKLKFGLNKLCKKAVCKKAGAQVPKYTFFEKWHEQDEIIDHEIINHRLSHQGVSPM